MKLRFKEENNIIKDNKNNDTKKTLIKITWIEANIKYILNILKIYNNLKINYEKEDILIDLIEDIIKNQKISYITNKKKIL